MPAAARSSSASSSVSVRARSSARRLALQALFQRHFNEDADAEQLAGQFLEEERAADADAEYLRALLCGVIGDCEQIDLQLQPLLDREMDTLDAVELALLRIGAWELREQPQLTPRQIISEAVRLAGIFGAADSYKYINAVLDRLAAALRKEDAEPSKLSEFEIIQRYFAPLHQDRKWLAAGIGEDCAVFTPPAGRQLVSSTDTLAEGTHFPPGSASDDIAQRALRVALSDLAACGARALGFSLALSLPQAEEQWLEQFASGLAAAAQEFDAPLLGGDLVRGPLLLNVHVFGTVPQGAALRRNGVSAGDRIYVSGSLGGAAAALAVLEERIQAPPDVAEKLLQRYWRPQPRLALGQALQGAAGAAIDVSDGLLADVGHLAQAGGVRIRIDAERLPLHPGLDELAGAEEALRWALGGGDDYELCFSVPQQAERKLRARAKRLGIPCTAIGEAQAGEAGEVGVECAAASDLPAGWTHF